VTRRAPPPPGQAGDPIALPPSGSSAIAPRATLPPGVGPTTLFATARGSGLVLAAALAATRTAGTGLILAATFAAARPPGAGSLLPGLLGLGFLLGPVILAIRVRERGLATCAPVADHQQATLSWRVRRRCVGMARPREAAHHDAQWRANGTCARSLSLFMGRPGIGAICAQGSLLRGVGHCRRGAWRKLVYAVGFLQTIRWA
jgi:hypothetical protein